MARTGMSSACRVAALLMIAALPAWSQFGPPESQGSGPKLEAVTVFPAPGTYPTTESVTLLNADAQATIHYTLDGSMPTRKSPVYDPLQVLFLTGVYDGDHGLKAGYTIRAVAMREGRTNSDVANFQFVIDRRSRDQYVSEEILPGVRMIRDSDNDKMFLIRGRTKNVLVDSGQGNGALLEYMKQYAGGLPIEPVFTHSHSDHIGQADQFVRQGVERIGAEDRPVLVKLLKQRGVPDDVIEKNVIGVRDGETVDMGDRVLTIYAVPGHTPGSLAVFDAKTGYLFTGDSYGSNSPTIPDALWLQWSQEPLDGYLATVKTSRANFRGHVTKMMTGHNDHPLEGEGYLDNLQTALQRLMDEGQAALVPSYRPAGVKQVLVGDRLKDPNWASINVNVEHFLPAPIEKIVGLSLLAVEGAKLSPMLQPAVKEYTVTLPGNAREMRITAEPTATRSTMTLNGKPLSAGQPQAVALSDSLHQATVVVTSPDGSAMAKYVVKVDRK